MTKRTAYIALTITCVVQIAALAGNAAFDETRYKIPGQGKLYLEVPEDWDQDTTRYGQFPRYDITFSPAGADAIVLLSLIWNPNDASAVDRKALHGIVTDSIERTRGDAVEDELSMVEFRGDGCFGFYFSAEDKKQTLGPGDYRYMTQGMAAAGELGLSFTVLSNSDANGIAEAAIAMFQRARFENKR